MLENLRIRRVAVHEVFQRGADRRPVPPAYATALETLPAEALDAFRQRIVEALSAQAKSVEMQISQYGDDSFLADAELLMHADAEEFLALSCRIPDRLVLLT